MAKKSAETMQRARIAIRKGDLAGARRLLQQVIRDDPQNHAAWRLLAKITPSQEAAAAYVKRAESLRPDSLLVQRGQTELEEKEKRGTGRAQYPRWPMAILISGLALLLTVIAAGLGPLAWERVSALKSDPVAAVTSTATLAPTLALISHTELTPIPTVELMATPTMRPTQMAGEATRAVVKSEEEAAAKSEEATATAIALIPDDPTGLRPSGVRPDERWIDVNLSTQTLVAYEGNTPVYDSLISGGTQDFPTITGQYRTYMKYEKQDMNGYLLGYDYYLENVPYVMYFWGDYAIHGTYWHNDFGYPMSHGCVNASPEDAGWLYDWAPVGTMVNIHY
jgi:lipoprotein-anchoring transpeptidase ErfK/SrfK